MPKFYPRASFFALTANAMNDQTAAYLEAGMDGVVSKPVDVRELLGAVLSVQEGRVALRANTVNDALVIPSVARSLGLTTFYPRIA